MSITITESGMVFGPFDDKVEATRYGYSNNYCTYPTRLMAS